MRRLLDFLAGTPLASWGEELLRRSEYWLAPDRHGDLPRWLAALDALPRSDPPAVDWGRAEVTARGDASGREVIEQALQELRPWRKGPYDLHGVAIDSEWRSDFKWDRIQPHLDDLSGRRVLDVGCGNGYFGWRLLGQGAAGVIGIDPTLLFVVQHLAVRRLMGEHPNWVLPLAIEDLPDDLSGFDTVLSMGVLSHRRSPIDHLQRLHGLLRPGGQLVLETLVIEGGDDQVLVPADRYARMRNVWFLPSPGLLGRWLGRCRFVDIECVDVSRTTVDEQRSTHWMPFESLAQCLDPEDPERTVEGLPAPCRAVMTARRA